MTITLWLFLLSVMTSNQTIPWDGLEKRSASAWLIAGGLQLLLVAQNVLRAHTDLYAPEFVGDFMLGTAGILALLGLLGLVPPLRQKAPRLARAASIAAALGMIGLLAVVIGEPVLKSLLGAGDEPPAWFAPVLILYIIGVPLSFLLSGTASLRTKTPSRRVGAVLLYLFVWFLVFFHLFPIYAFIGGFSPRITELAIALGFIAVGYLLRSKSLSSGRTEPSSDPTVS